MNTCGESFFPNGKAPGYEFDIPLISRNCRFDPCRGRKNFPLPPPLSAAF